MELTDKIDSEEKFDQLGLSLSKRGEATNTLRAMGYLAKPWWAVREALRLRDLYDTSEVLNTINKARPIFAHVSLKDKTLVAYTPDRNAGLQDQQRITSLGKLLAQVYPLQTEDAARELIETHTAEVNTVVKFYDRSKISEIYLKVRGTGSKSCMTSSGSQEAVKLYEDVEGISIAVVERPNGEIIARSLVYEARKEFIRCYGSPALLKWFLKNGYKPGTHAGARFKVVTRPNYPNEVYMPYLDCENGMSDTMHCSVMRFKTKTEDFLLVLTPEQRHLAMKHSLRYGTPGAGGSMLLAPTDNSSLAFTDPITGETKDYFKDTFETVKVWHEGAEVEVLESTRVSGNFNCICKKVWVKDTDIVWLNGNPYINNDKEMEKLGLVKLDAEIYSSREILWVYSSLSAKVGDKTVLRSETSRVVSSAGEIINELTASLGKDYVKLYDGSYAHKDSGIQRVGARKAKAHRLFHDFCELWDGSLVFKRGVKSENLFWSPIYYRKGERDAAIAGSIDKAEGEFISKLDSEPSELETLMRGWSRINSKSTYIYNSDNTDLRSALSVQGTSHLSLRAILRLPVALMPAALDIFTRRLVQSTEDKRLNYRVQVLLSDMLAVEGVTVEGTPQAQDRTVEPVETAIAEYEIA